MLQRSRRSILSLLEGAPGPCYVGGVRNHIEQQPERYLGEIYVARLTPCGEPFRVDLPDDAPKSHEDILSELSGLAGDYGYPEELKLVSRITNPYSYDSCSAGREDLSSYQISGMGTRKWFKS